MIWTFDTQNFHIECTEDEASFIDPLVHSQIVIDAVNRGRAIVTNVCASVYRRGVEVGSATIRDCIHADVCEWRDIVVIGQRYRHEAVRMAIRAARKSLADLRDDVPDLNLRHTI